MQELPLCKELALYIGLLVAIVALFFLLYRRLVFCENEKKALQSMLSSLLTKYSNRDQILSKYVYDTRLGIYKRRTNGLFYCHKCLIEKTMESPLQTQKNGWFCPVCSSFYSKPSDYISANE